MDFPEKIADMLNSTRIAVLRELREERHPDYLAEKFGVTRQAVDKHLSILYSLGMVDRRVKNEARLKVYYVITPEGEDFLDGFFDLAMNHLIALRKRYKEGLFNLDRMLVEGEMSEAEYRRMRKALDKRFSWVMER